MIRLLVASIVAYATYRVAKEAIDAVPDGFDPLPMPDDERALRRQSAAMGVAPRR